MTLNSEDSITIKLNINNIKLYYVLYYKTIYLLLENILSDILFDLKIQIE